MPRYEDMDDILQQVRDRFGVGDGQPVDQALVDAQLERYYTELLEGLLLAVRQLAQLREQLASYQRHMLGLEQRTEVQGLLEKALRDVRTCQKALEGS